MYLEKQIWLWIMKANAQVSTITIKKMIKFTCQNIFHKKVNACLGLIYSDIGPCLNQCKEFGIGENQCRNACYCMDSCLKEIDTEDSHLVNQELIKCSEKCRKIYQGK